MFGASTSASAAVLAIFIGGLGFGGWLLGRRVDAVPRPLAFYAKLELTIAASAAVSPLLLSLVRSIYIAAGGTLALGMGAGTALRIVLAALVLAVPTIAMGGTLAAATRAIAGESDVRRRRLAILYGTNTLGAVVGALLATFFLLEVIGTRRTIWVAALVNALIAMLALRRAREADASRGRRCRRIGRSIGSGCAGRASPSSRARRIRAGGLRVLLDGDDVVPDARADPRRDRVHVRLITRDRVAGHRGGRAHVRTPR